jgi:hypothetical protein
VSFNDASTWKSLGGGVSLGAEAVAEPEFSLIPNYPGIYAIFDVSDSITSLASAAALGQDLNYGWLINPSSTDAWRYRSSEFGSIDDRPIISITYAVPQPTIFGDYNQNGTVDAADYVVWRKMLDQTIVLPNDFTPGIVSHSDYEVWRAHFGKLKDRGVRCNGGSSIPEPNAFALLILAAVGVVCRPSISLS